MSDSFSARLETLLDGRKITPWGKTLGLSNSVIEALSKGTVPGPDHLKIIARAENANLNFLLTGAGCPFVVNPAPDNVNPENEVFLLGFGGLRAVVVIKDASHVFERSGKESHFKELTIYRGIGFNVEKIKNPRCYQFPAISELLAGKLSKHALIGKEKDGLLYLARPTLEPWSAVASEHIDQDLMRVVLELTDRVANGLDINKKSRIISAVYAHAIRRGLDADQINTDFISPIADAIRG
jgi:hypothetical protein